MKITDRMANWILAKLDVVDLVREWFPDYQEDGNVVCPYHEESAPSLHISCEGKAYCHGCGWSAMNIIDLYAKMEGCSYMDARQWLYENLVNAVSARLVNRHHELLMKNGKAIDYLTGRFVSDFCIQGYRLGYNPNNHRITLPIMDQFGTCVNIRSLAWEKGRNSRCKVINLKGHAEVRLFPEDRLVAEDPTNVLLVEGEMDALVGWSFGIPTVTWTGGATSYNKDYEWLFRDRNVFILYDNDEAGRRGARNQLARLKDVCRVTALYPLMEEGKDLSDWAKLDPVKVQFLAEDINNHKGPANKGQDRCPYCGQAMPEEV